MKTKIIRQSVAFRASPHAAFEALMDQKKHSRFTGGSARVSRKVGGAFRVYGGLHGTNLEIKRDKKIVQAWHCEMRGWPKKHFSRATFAFQKIKGGTRLTFVQTGVPASCYREISAGWREYYWKPMKVMLEP